MNFADITLFYCLKYLPVSTAITLYNMAPIFIFFFEAVYFKVPPALCLEIAEESRTIAGHPQLPRSGPHHPARLHLWSQLGTGHERGWFPVVRANDALLGRRTGLQHASGSHNCQGHSSHRQPPPKQSWLRAGQWYPLQFYPPSSPLRGGLLAPSVGAGRDSPRGILYSAVYHQGQQLGQTLDSDAIWVRECGSWVFGGCAPIWYPVYDPDGGRNGLDECGSHGQLPLGKVREKGRRSQTLIYLSLSLFFSFTYKISSEGNGKNQMEYLSHCHLVCTFGQVLIYVIGI